MTTTMQPTAWAKLSTRLGREGPVALLRHMRSVALLKAHTALERRTLPKGCHDTTDGKIELHHLAVVGPHRAVGIHYLPTPRRVLDWVHRSLPRPGESTTFLDYGCGKGRALLSATQVGYGHVVGVEFSRELAAEARTNVDDILTRSGGRIAVHEVDAAEFAIPSGPLVVFLFNPFGSPVIDRVAAGIARSHAATPRPILIAYLNPVHADVVARNTGFARQRLDLESASRFAVLSPYRLAIFASPEAAAQSSHQFQSRHWR